MVVEALVGEILVTPLKRIPLQEGDVMHAMKRGDPGFIDFGEAYFSLIHADSIKAWKRHLRMTLNLVVPIGDVKFAFVDEEGNSRTEEIGEDRYCRLTVPPGIWFGFKGLGKPYSLLANLADIPHDPEEVERVSIKEFIKNREDLL